MIIEFIIFIITVPFITLFVLREIKANDKLKEARDIETLNAWADLLEVPKKVNSENIKEFRQRLLNARFINKKRGHDMPELSEE